MKLCTGVDLIEVERIQAAIDRYGERFLGRIFTLQELAEVRDLTCSLAARFAAKEAVSKALGTGIGAVGWREIEILHGTHKEPVLRLHGAAARRALELGLGSWSVSLAHTRDHAIAMVVAMEE